MYGLVLDVYSGQLNTSNLSLFLELLFYLQPHRCSLDLPCPMLSYEASHIDHALCACSYLDHCPYCSRLLRLHTSGHSTEGQRQTDRSPAWSRQSIPRMLQSCCCVLLAPRDCSSFRADGMTCTSWCYPALIKP